MAQRSQSALMKKQTETTASANNSNEKHNKSNSASSSSVGIHKKRKKQPTYQYQYSSSPFMRQQQILHSPNEIIKMRTDFLNYLKTIAHNINEVRCFNHLVHSQKSVKGIQLTRSKVFLPMQMCLHCQTLTPKKDLFIQDLSRTFQCTFWLITISRSNNIYCSESSINRYYRKYSKNNEYLDNDDLLKALLPQIQFTTVSSRVEQIYSAHKKTSYRYQCSQASNQILRTMVATLFANEIKFMNKDYDMMENITKFNLQKGAQLWRYLDISHANLVTLQTYIYFITDVRIRTIGDELGIQIDDNQWQHFLFWHFKTGKKILDRDLFMHIITNFGQEKRQTHKGHLDQLVKQNKQKAYCIEVQNRKKSLEKDILQRLQIIDEMGMKEWAHTFNVASGLDMFLNKQYERTLLTGTNVVYPGDVYQNRMARANSPIKTKKQIKKVSKNTKNIRFFRNIPNAHNNELETFLNQRKVNNEALKRQIAELNAQTSNSSKIVNFSQYFPDQQSREKISESFVKNQNQNKEICKTSRAPRTPLNSYHDPKLVKSLATTAHTSMGSTVDVSAQKYINPIKSSSPSMNKTTTNLFSTTPASQTIVTSNKMSKKASQSQSKSNRHKNPCHTNGQFLRSSSKKLKDYRESILKKSNTTKPTKAQDTLFCKIGYTVPENLIKSCVRLGNKANC